MPGKKVINSAVVPSEPCASDGRCRIASFLSVAAMCALGAKVHHSFSTLRALGAAWHLDSGANTIVVDSEDTDIIEKLLGESVTLHSTTETVQAQSAIIQTPIGSLKGLVFAGAPRLIPTDYFQEKYPLKSP